MNKRSQNKGYAFIELISAIAIIAILIIIVTPIYIKNFKESKKIVCLYNQKVINMELSSEIANGKNISNDYITKLLKDQYGCEYKNNGYTGICKSKGIVTIDVREDVIITNCSIHGKEN